MFVHVTFPAALHIAHVAVVWHGLDHRYINMGDEFCVYVGNLDLRVSVADLEELLYELFLQVYKSV